MITSEQIKEYKFEIARLDKLNVSIDMVKTQAACSCDLVLETNSDFQNECCALKELGDALQHLEGAIRSIMRAQKYMKEILKGADDEQGSN